MKIGIDASRAFLKNRTGIEEYSYQTIMHLRDFLDDDQARLASTSGHLRESRRVVLYIRKSHKSQVASHKWPENWKIKVVNFPRLWTQVGLSLEMLLHPVDVLFVPAHTVPIIHPEKTIVVVHGLEYEFCPDAYSWIDRFYMRLTIRKSCQWASGIVAVSENTKKDLVRLYKVPENKIKVIYEGYGGCHSERSESDVRKMNEVEESGGGIIASEIKDGILTSRLGAPQDDKFLLFVGRIEQRKNIENIIKAFEILKEKYNISQKLVLAGRPGHGYEKIKSQILNLKSKKDIVELGYVSEDEKWELLKKADVFVFPTLYEGFGIPILEAQSVGTPVVASNNSSISEVALDSALLVDPKNSEEIAESVNLLISDKSAKNAIIAKGLENVKRFSWEKCAREVASVFKELS